MNSKRRLVLLSGGPDSMVLAYRLAREPEPIHTVFLRHGRLRNQKELAASAHVARALNAPLDIADLSGIRALYVGNKPGGPSVEPGEAVDRVIDGDDTPEEKLLFHTGLSPFSIMMTMALYYAHVVDCSEVNIGLIKSQTRDRPDMRKYLDELSRIDTILNPRLPRVEIRTPQLEMSKPEIIALGLEMGVPFELSWSCLMGGEVHCGRCSHCVSRREAFQEVGAPDPTVYAA